MASVSSLGIGTGVDLQNMLTKILAAERAPISRIDAQISSAKSKISVYGTLNSKLDSFKSAAETWQFPSRLSAMGASSSETSVLNASASFMAAVGSYTMEVTQLASPQKSYSDAYAAGTTFGAGSIEIRIDGGSPISVPVDAGSTLSQVSAQINSAKAGITATVVTSGDGSQRMILTGDKPGAENSFTLTSSAAPSSGQALEVATLTDSEIAIANAADGLMRSSAKDAKMKIDGIEVTSSTNTFSSAIQGLTLTAAKLGTSNITVNTDTAKITTAVQAFVDGYNEVAKVIKSNSSYDEATKTAKALNGDSSARSVLSVLGSVRTSVPSELSSANLKALHEIGISIQQSGELKLDTAKLEKAIKDTPNDVTNLLQAYGKEYATAITNLQSSNGTIGFRVKSLNESVSRFNASKESMEARIALVEKRYRAQFTALDKYVNSMQTTSGYLGQQLAMFTK
ncbi:MAG: flagellar filament capping protein FliD [Dechloromonas sp.]|uniref:flagellar filament capping protein FliD n=1 Tax=Azonexus hydrophilus TaxID=418702 RepID=UPI0004011ACC|nr:flagellar filament capping protein FliD [Azonexus hydrophilus]MCA1939055.1 flagellar filament capping protein FliD [Dechloromonas sp.]